jgi:hypothetical protein
MPKDVETKVRITGDTTGLDKLGRAAKEAFDPQTAKKFGRAALDVNRELKQLVGTQAQLTREMRGVERGTKQYEQLATKLEDANTEAKQLKAELRDINKIAARPRRQGFVAGVAQGVGVAQYIPTGPGMGARMGGAALGGMARRAAGGMAAPFVSPGVGGFAGALGAIPFIGQAAGAAVMAGQGYFQQAIAFDRARIENLPYAQWRTSGEMDRRKIIADERIRQIRTAGRIQERQAVKRRARLARTSAEQMAERLGGPRAGAMGRGAAFEGMLDQIDRAMEEGVKTPAEYQQWLNRRTGLGVTPPTIEELNRTPREIRQRTRQQVESVRRWSRQRVYGLPTAGAGAKYGFAPTAVQGMFGEYMGARGGVARVQNEFRDVMVARRLFGVGAGLAGGYGRMMQPGAGGAGPGIARTIATALATGLRGSLITEHLQTLVQQGRQMEQEGVRFDISNLTGSAATLRALGMQGMQPTRVMGQMQAAARGVSARGVSGPMDLLMARAAGYRPEGGAESYAAAMNMLAGGLSPEMMTGLLGQITQGARGGDWGPQMQRMLVRRAMGQMGVRVGPEQAGMLLQGFQGGQLTGEAQSVLADIQQRSGRMGAEGFARQARLGAGIVGGKAVYAAGAEAQQIATGNKLAGMYMNLERVGRRSVSALSGFSSQLETASNFVLQAFKRIDEVAQKIGTGTSVVEAVAKVVGGR